MNQESFHTIKNPTEGAFKDRGSKFLAFAFPVINEQQVSIRLDELRKKYHDARHHCYAYVLGADGQIQRANDDGEPTHSAGDPILGQLRSRELTYTLVVVVRYFGGTKLGVSGLIQAYKTAASEALDCAKKIKKFITTPVSINFRYEQMNEVMRMIKSMDLKIVEQKFEIECRIVCTVKPSQVALIHQLLNPFPDIKVVG